MYFAYPALSFNHMSMMSMMKSYIYHVHDELIQKANFVAIKIGYFINVMTYKWKLIVYLSIFFKIFDSFMALVCLFGN